MKLSTPKTDNIAMKIYNIHFVCFVILKYFLIIYTTNIILTS